MFSNVDMPYVTTGMLRIWIINEILTFNLFYKMRVIFQRKNWFIKPGKAIASIPELRKNLGVEKESESDLAGEKTFEMDEELVELFLLALAPL